MKASELFGVAVRVIGLVMITYGIILLSFAMLNIVGGGPVNVLVLLLCSVPLLCVGTWFLRGAALLIMFAYPEQNEN
jgi:hypothetical protein